METEKGGTTHCKVVISHIVDKVLVNLNVISKVEQGDKLDWTPEGHFSIMKANMWTSAIRWARGTKRTDTLTHLKDTVELACRMSGDSRYKSHIREAVQIAIHGLRNLTLTYQDDVLFKSRVDVLLKHMEVQFKLTKDEML